MGTRGHFITFPINTMDILCFIFCSQDYLNWLTTDILQLLHGMQILTEVMAKGIIFKVFTHAFAGVQNTGLGGHNLPHDNLKDDILSRPSSVVSMGECIRRSGQLSPVSIQYVLQGVWTAIQIALSLSFHPSISCISLSFCGQLSHSHKHCWLYRDRQIFKKKENYRYEVICRNQQGKGIKLTKHPCTYHLN